MELAVACDNLTNLRPKILAFKIKLLSVKVVLFGKYKTSRTKVFLVPYFQSLELKKPYLRFCYCFSWLT